MPTKNQFLPKTWFVPTIIAIITVLTGIVIYFYGSDILELIFQPATTPLPDSQPKLEWQLPWYVWAMLLIPILFFILWKFLRQRWAQHYLIRKAVTEYPNLTRLPVAWIEKYIFQPLRHTAQQLRKHINIPSHRLNVKATVEKTIHAANCFTPVTGTTKSLPEYLVLIDTTSFKDHQASLVTVLIKTIAGRRCVNGALLF